MLLKNVILILLQYYLLSFGSYLFWLAVKLGCRMSNALNQKSIKTEIVKFLLIFAARELLTPIFKAMKERLGYVPIIILGISFLFAILVYHVYAFLLIGRIPTLSPIYHKNKHNIISIVLLCVVLFCYLISYESQSRLLHLHHSAQNKKPKAAESSQVNYRASNFSVTAEEKLHSNDETILIGSSSSYLLKIALGSLTDEQFSKVQRNAEIKASQSQFDLKLFKKESQKILIVEVLEINADTFFKMEDLRGDILKEARDLKHRYEFNNKHQFADSGGRDAIFTPRSKVRRKACVLLMSKNNSSIKNIFNKENAAILKKKTMQFFA